MMECGIMKTTLLLFYFDKQLTCPGEAGCFRLQTKVERRKYVNARVF